MKSDLVMSVYPSVVAGVLALPVSDWRSAAHLIDHTLLKPEVKRTARSMFTVASMAMIIRSQASWFISWPKPTPLCATEPVNWIW